MKKELIVCDVCGDDIAKKIFKRPIQVVFTTEQNEGRSVTPYLSEEDLDLCQACLDMITQKGRVLFASGAMGYNDYSFKPAAFYTNQKDE